MLPDRRRCRRREPGSGGGIDADQRGRHRVGADERPRWCMFMTPGLALFYGGMVRAKNVLAMLMQNFFCLGLVSVLWAVCVYSLAFQRARASSSATSTSRSSTAREHGARHGLRRYRSRRSSFVGVPDDVRGHHARADHRRDRRPHEVLGVVLVHRAVGAARVHAGRALGVLARRAGCSGAARSTSPAARSCTSTRASPRSSRCSCSAGGAAGPNHPIAAALAAAHAARRRHPVVRLVRLQRRLGARGQRHRRAGAHQHAPRGGGGDARLAARSSASAAGTPTTLGAASGAVAGLVAITPCAGLRRRHGARSCIGFVAGASATSR